MTGEEHLLLVIGAGATKGAREILSPPLGGELKTFVQDELQGRESCLPEHGLDSTLQFLRVSSECNWEKLIENEICNYNKTKKYAHIKTIENLNRALVFSFCNSDVFKKGEDLYSKLVMKLGNNTKISVVSLNYDILFEQAANTQKNIHYVGTNSNSTPVSDKSSIYLYKPHGSIGFCLPASNATTLNAPLNRWASTPINGLPGSDWTMICPKLEYDDIRTELMRSRSPVIAHYADTKPILNARNIIDEIRDKTAAIEFTKAVVIGVSYPKSHSDDPTLKNLLDRAAALSKKSPNNVKYVEPSKEIVTKLLTAGFHKNSIYSCDFKSFVINHI